MGLPVFPLTEMIFVFVALITLLLEGGFRNIQNVFHVKNKEIRNLHHMVITIMFFLKEMQN